jgi:Ubiquitin elongating factor core
LNFLNFLINDSIYLLDESLNKILELKQIEAEMANTVEWERRPVQEREERTRTFHSSENVSSCLVLMSKFHDFIILLLSVPNMSNICKKISSLGVICKKNEGLLMSRWFDCR